MTSEEFKSVFEDTWRKRLEVQGHKDEILQAYRKNATWTEFMLGKRGGSGFLLEVGERLNRRSSKEYYTLDCVYYKENPNLIDGGVYPAGFSAIIEHENGERVEEEMWKLLMWRAPLKVLVFYDYPDDVKKQDNQDTKYADWLPTKFKYLASMAREIHEHCPEGPRSEYTFVVGSVSMPGQSLRWRYYRLCQKAWKVEELV